MKLHNFSLIVFLILVAQQVEPRRGSSSSGSRGGSRSSWSSSSSSRKTQSSSSSKSGSKGLFGGLFGGSKKTSNKGSNKAPVYPKQKYPTQTGSKGTGGIPPAGTNGNKGVGGIPAAGTNGKPLGNPPPYPGKNSGSTGLGNPPAYPGTTSSKGWGSSSNTNMMAGLGASKYSGAFTGKSKSSNFNKFAAGGAGAAGGMAFGKTMGKSKYLGGIKKKHIVAAGAAYVGYQAAKAIGKGLGKAYYMGMARPGMYHSSSWYRDNDDYWYRGQLNEHCDVWYDSDDREEILRCDRGYYYNYDYENRDSPMFRSGYSSFNSRPNDWDRRDEYSKLTNDFDNDNRNINYEKVWNDSPELWEQATETAVGILKFIGYLIIAFVICCCCCGYFGYKKMTKKSSSRSSDSSSVENQPMNTMNAPNPVSMSQMPPPAPGYVSTDYNKAATPMGDPMGPPAYAANGYAAPIIPSDPMVPGGPVPYGAYGQADVGGGQPPVAGLPYPMAGAGGMGGFPPASAPPASGGIYPGM